MSSINLRTIKAVLDDARKHVAGVITEYHVSDEICILLKPRDMVIIKKTNPRKGKQKKVVSWRKKTNEEIVDLLKNLDWEA
jgi:hypothetical protein